MTPRSLYAWCGSRPCSAASIADILHPGPPRRIVDPARLARVDAALASLAAVGGETIKLRVTAHHRLTLHYADGSAAALDIYERSLVQSPVDTSFGLGDAGPLLRALDLA